MLLEFLPMAGTPKKREGSRLLLAVGLAAAVVAAFLAGGFVGGIVADTAGVTSGTGRLLIRLAGVVVAVPAAFYLVERLFLTRSSRP